MAFENIHTYHDYFLNLAESDQKTRVYVDIFPSETVMRFEEVLEIRYNSDTEKGVVRGASRLMTSGVLEDVTRIYGVLDEVPTHDHILTNSNFLHVLYGSRSLIEYLERAPELSKTPGHMFQVKGWFSYAFLFSLAIGVLYGILKPVAMHYVIGDNRMSPKMLIVVFLEAALHLCLFHVVLMLQKSLYGSMSFLPLMERNALGRFSVIRNRLLGFIVGGLMPLNVCIFLAYYFGAPASLQMDLKTAGVAFFCGGFMFGAVAYVVERFTMFFVTGNCFNNEMMLPYRGESVGGWIWSVSRIAYGALKDVTGFKDGVASIRMFMGRVLPVVFTYLFSTFLGETSLIDAKGVLPVVENTIFFCILILTMAVEMELEYKLERYVANIGRHPRHSGNGFQPFL